MLCQTLLVWPDDWLSVRHEHSSEWSGGPGWHWTSHHHHCQGWVDSGALSLATDLHSWVGRAARLSWEAQQALIMKLDPGRANSGDAKKSSIDKKAHSLSYLSTQNSFRWHGPFFSLCEPLYLHEGYIEMVKTWSLSSRRSQLTRHGSQVEAKLQWNVKTLS